MNNKEFKSSDKHKSTGKGAEKQFICRYCRRTVNIEAPGTSHRNHCPWCLRSVHLDKRVGDRSSFCNGIMEPIAVSVRRNGEWMLIHRCNECGELKANRIAGDDNEAALL
jgi:hypothetical protein